MFKKNPTNKKKTKYIRVKQRLQILRNLCIFSLKILFLVLTLSKIVKQSISNFISLILLIIDMTIEAK